MSQSSFLLSLSSLSCYHNKNKNLNIIIPTTTWKDKRKEKRRKQRQKKQRRKKETNLDEGGAGQRSGRSRVSNSGFSSV